MPKRSEEGERKREGERTPPFIVNDYGNLHILVCIFLNSALLEDYDRSITANFS